MSAVAHRDNVPANGEVARRVVVTLAERVDANVRRGAKVAVASGPLPAAAQRVLEALDPAVAADGDVVAAVAEEVGALAGSAPRSKPLNAG